MSAHALTSFWKESSLDEQKREIEEVLLGYLSHQADLTNRQKHLLRNALGHTRRGLFPVARQDMHESSLPESAWTPIATVMPEMGARRSHEALCRALAYLAGTPA